MDLREQKTTAHVAPLLVFLVLLALPGFIKVDNSELPWWKYQPEHWVYPLQVLVCAILLWRWRRFYTFGPFSASGIVLGGIAGILGLALWLLPAWLYGYFHLSEWDAPGWLKDTLGLAERKKGFNPDIFAEHPTAWWTTTLLRLLRMTLIVPIIEELAWRSFLWRYLHNPDRDFSKIPFGIWSPRAISITIIAFMLVHHQTDWLGCLIYGIIISAVALRTKSLAACIICHATTNLGLGLYVLATKQWGYW